MDLIRAIILGVIQALTEFLPISSSAHLILFRDWLGLESVDGLTFDVALHIGTVAALVGYFRRDLARVIRGALSFLRGVDATNIEQRLALYIIVATIPAAVVGVLFADIIDTVLRVPAVIVVTLIAGGVLFLVVERRCRPERDLDQISFGSAIAVGLAQSLALIPGVSRAGITIATGMMMNLRREEAARFSFLLAVPIMLGAGAKKVIDLRDVSLGTDEQVLLFAGTLVSAAAAWVVLKYLLRFLQNHSLNVFAYYRFALAAVVVVWLFVTGG